MKHEIAMAWVADLRANPDKQGTGFLSKDGKDCCLGRLCRLLNAPMMEIKGVVLFDGEKSALPKSVQRQAGIRSKTGIVRKDPDGTSVLFELIVLNDSGHTFAEIADLIEQHWEKL